MGNETNKLADKVVNDLGDLIHWTARPEVTRTIRKTLHADEERFRRLNEESYGRER